MNIMLYAALIRLPSYLLEDLHLIYAIGYFIDLFLYF